MSDAFNEVEEQLRAERYSSLFRKSWPWVTGALAVALVAALAYWGWDAYGRAQEGKASVVYARALDDQNGGKPAEAEKAYETLSKSSAKSYRALALMQLAGLRNDAGKTADAVALLDRAQAATGDKLLKDAAALKAGLLLVDTAPLAEVQRRLEPLTAAGRPYRMTAREALGVARLAAGKTTEARGDFAVLALAVDASDSTRARARAALAVIDAGEAAAIPATIKAAAALPKQAMVLPPQLQAQLQQQQAAQAQ